MKWWSKEVYFFRSNDDNWPRETRFIFRCCEKLSMRKSKRESKWTGFSFIQIENDLNHYIFLYFHSHLFRCFRFNFDIICALKILNNKWELNFWNIEKQSEIKRKKKRARHKKKTNWNRKLNKSLWKFMCIFDEMAHQVVEVVVRCETANETKHLGNKTMPNLYEENYLLN